MSRVCRVCLYISCFFFVAAGIGMSQQLQPSDEGLRPLASFGNGQYEKIDLSNLYLSWKIPVFTQPGSPDLGLSYALIGQPNIQAGIFGEANGFVAAVAYPCTGSCIKLGLSYSLLSESLCTNSTDAYSAWVYTDGGGSIHPFGNAPIVGLDCNGSFTTASTDNSGYTLYVSSVTGINNYCSPVIGGSLFAAVTDAAGLAVYTNCGEYTYPWEGTVSDPNGNYLNVSGNETGSCTLPCTYDYYVNNFSGVTESIPVPSGSQTIRTHQYPGPTGTETINVTASNSTLYWPQLPVPTVSPWSQYQLIDCALPVTMTIRGYSYGYPSTNGLGVPFKTSPGYLPTNVSMPDGAQFNISYEQTPNNPTDTTGRPASLQIPSGGTVQYAYTGGSNNTGINCADGTYAVITRTTPDGVWTYTHTPPTGTILRVSQFRPISTGNEVIIRVSPLGHLQTPPFVVGQTVTFAGLMMASPLNGKSTPITTVLQNSTPGAGASDDITVSYSGPQPSCPNFDNFCNEIQGDIYVGSTISTTVVQDPAGNQTVYSFSGMYQTTKLVYQGTQQSGTLLLTEIDCYNGAVANCSSPSSLVTSPISQKDVYIYWPGVSQPSVTSTIYNSFGVATDVRTFDFGGNVTTNANLVRETATQYGSYSGSISTTYSGTCYPIESATRWFPYINDRPCTIITYDSSHNPQAVSVFQYDGAGNVTVRNDIDPIRQTNLATYFTNNANGSLLTSKDPFGTVTTFSDTSCDNLFPTTVTTASLSRSFVWNCSGGVVTTTTDENKNAWQYGFADPFWRLTSFSDPMNTSSYPTTETFSYAPTTLEAKMTPNAGKSTNDVLRTVDQMGRMSLIQVLHSGTTTYSSSETDYDSNGNPSRVTVPYSANPGITNSTVVATHTTYDALSRPLIITSPANGVLTYTYKDNDVTEVMTPIPSGEVSKSRQYEYDGLGRIKSVCEVTTLPGSGPCGQAVAQTGYLTTYAYGPLGQIVMITQNAQSTSQQVRSFSYDAHGRLISESTPEAGTVLYTYDSDPAAVCPSHIGDLIKTVDNATNVTCYNYDGFHRITGISYPSGPNASTTPSKNFVYDTTTFTCPNGSNVIGRLSEAFTGSSTDKITDEAFCYSARGELTDYYQETPHSGGYVHISAAYWENGDLESVSGIPGMTTVSYGMDSVGRVSTVSSTTGDQNPVTSTAYNIAEKITTLTYGSGDADSYGYTSYFNTSSFTHAVNGSSMKGVLTWNANGTVKELNVTDALNSSDAQTCLYSYDALLRLGSVSCGATIWEQTFSYDAFGNITKSVPTGGTGIGWNPGYNASNNHYTLAGTSYDGNGNVTDDLIERYTWNADGTMGDAGGITYTYDAFDRVVEANGTQFVYAPDGTMIASTSDYHTLVSAYVPLPGNATAVYTNNAGTVGLNHYRRPDWIGSSRVMSTPSRSLYFDTAYAPFGENYNGSGTRDLVFAQLNQDIPDGGGDFVSPLRHYSAAQGRWVSPDPQQGNLFDPQRLNRYAYARNTPLTNSDPSGGDPSDGGGDSGTPWVNAWLAWFGDSSSMTYGYSWQSGPLSGASSGGEYMGPWFGASLAPGVFQGPNGAIFSQAANTMNGVTAAYGGAFAMAGGAALGSAVGISELAVGTYHAGVAAYYVYGAPVVTALACAELCNGMPTSAPAFSELGSESSAIIPRGFKSAEQFEQATQELSQALTESGINDASIGVRGSSVTGASSKGVPFDSIRKSDIDFFVESKQLTQGLKTQPNIPGMVHEDKISKAFAPIANWSQRWTLILGRKVGVAGFQPGMGPAGNGVIRP
jgi:RHS repeat-associated protein